MAIEALSSFDLMMEERISAITEACTTCGKCFEACSMLPYTSLGGADPEAVTKSVVDIINGRPHAPEGAIWTEACQKSGVCIEACPEDVNPREMIFYAKTMLARSKLGEEKRAAKSQNFYRNVSRTIRLIACLQTDPELYRRLTAVRGEAQEKTDLVFYFGCHILKTPDILFACMDVFERMGLDFKVTGGLANCCGINHFRSGSPETGAALGSNSLREIQACNPEKVITFCPTCQMQYTEYRPLYEGPSNDELPFVHVTQYLAENIERLRTLCVHPVRKKVALHLHTGGPADLEANVKEILSCVPGLEVVDIEQHADHCYQCPTLVLPGAAEAMRGRLFSSAEAAGVDAVLTIYHSCQFELCAEEKGRPFVIENFMTILGRSMGFEYPDQLKAFKLYENVERVLDEAEDFLNARGIRPEKVKAQLQAALYG